MTATAVGLDLEALGPHFGSVVHGVDLGTATDEQLVAVRAALVERKVLFFRDQRLDDDGQVRLGRRASALTGDRLQILIFAQWIGSIFHLVGR